MRSRRHSLIAYARDRRLFLFSLSRLVFVTALVAVPAAVGVPGNDVPVEVLYFVPLAFAALGACTLQERLGWVTSRSNVRLKSLRLGSSLAADALVLGTGLTVSVSVGHAQVTVVVAAAVLAAGVGYVAAVAVGGYAWCVVAAVGGAMLVPIGSSVPSAALVNPFVGFTVYAVGLACYTYFGPRRFASD